MRWILIGWVVCCVAPAATARAQAGHHTRDSTPLPAVTLSGTVQAVREGGLEGCEICEACSDCRGTHVLLRTRSGRIEVHLAPAWFLDRIGFAPAAGDLMHVTGTRVRLPKGRGVAAHEVQVGNVLVRLRDEQGLPLWRRMLTDTREAARGTTGR
jgi:hypothetical protein